MRILVTGITGFAGSHLAEVLLARPGVDVFGASRTARWPESARHLAERVPLRVCDLANGAKVETLLQDVQPQQIFHLAGYPHVGRSMREPDAAWMTNLTATRNLYEAVLRWGGRPRILYVGSGQIYGDPEAADQAFDERCTLRPTTPYGASKAAADLASYQYTRTAGLEIVLARPFNQIGPRQAPEFAVAHFARQIAAIEQGRQSPLLETGNLNPRRDMTDVRDAVRAYVLLMDKGKSGEAFNVGTGRAYSMQEVVNRLLALAGVQAEVRQRPDLVRSRDIAEIRADATKLRRETGWAPLIALDQSLTDTLAYWRAVENPSEAAAPGTETHFKGPSP
ncbi:MAG TPA: GDP-mannose 4,6-dehydratase [Gemmataceae bacterium]